MWRWLLLLVACPLWGQTWTLQHQEAATIGCSGAGTCNLTATITAGRVGVLVVGDGPTAALPTSIKVGTTAWTVPAGCEIANANGVAYAAYSLNTNSGTQFTVVGTFATVGYAYYEYTLAGGTAAFDVCNAITATCSGSNITGAGLTLAGNDFVLTEVGNPNNIIVTGVSAAYGNFQKAAATGGTSIAIADKQNTGTAPAPTWSTSTCGGNSVATAIGFTGGGGASGPLGENSLNLTQAVKRAAYWFEGLRDPLWAALPVLIFRRRLAALRWRVYARLGLVDRPVPVRFIVADPALVRLGEHTARRCLSA